MFITGVQLALELAGKTFYPATARGCADHADRSWTRKPRGLEAEIIRVLRGSRKKCLGLP